jgi:hypothetical protein
VNEKIERRERSRTLVVRRFGRWVVADDLKTVLQQIFALR